MHRLAHYRLIGLQSYSASTAARLMKVERYIWMTLWCGKKSPWTIFGCSLSLHLQGIHLRTNTLKEDFVWLTSKDEGHYNKSWSKNIEAWRITYKYISEGSIVCVWNYVYNAKHYDQVKFKNVNNECLLYKLDGINRKTSIYKPYVKSNDYYVLQQYLKAFVSDYKRTIAINIQTITV